MSKSSGGSGSVAPTRPWVGIVITPEGQVLVWYQRDGLRIGDRGVDRGHQAEPTTRTVEAEELRSNSSGKHLCQQRGDRIANLPL